MRMARNRFALALTAALLVGVPAAYVAPNLPHAVAQEADAIREARRLKDEGTKHFRVAGDTDLSHKERVAARREAHSRFKEALRLMDEYLDAHTDEAEDYDKLYVEIRSMLYWVKKEAGVGEFGPERPDPEPEPEPEKTDPGPTKPPPGADGAGATAPSAPEPEPEPQGPTAADELGVIEAYGTKHPGDVPGLHERYSSFLSRFPDRDADEYATAMERLEVLDQQLKDVYRTIRDDDPDALDVDEGDIGKLVDELTRDLVNGDEAVRERAAKFLGALGSGKAGPPLLKALKKAKQGPVYDACVESLAKIGGKRVTRRLLKVKPTSKYGMAVLDVLKRTVERGGVNARLAGEALATYVVEFNEATQEEAAELLFGAGAPGAVGLAMVVDLAPTSKKVDYIKHLGELKAPRTSGPLAVFLEPGVRGIRLKMQKAARDAILAIDKPGVRYLIPALDNEKVRIWTAEMLRRITGADVKGDKRKTWEKWYRKHRRELQDL
jgi:PBS lyase HEAT-like repeat-containing protein